jgi:hypothetical protein
LSVTSPCRVVASHVRWPLKLAGLTIYRLVTDSGDFVSVTCPDVFDHAGLPSVLTAELMPGSAVRVQTNDAGAMTAVQLIRPIYQNPFSET